MLLGAGDRGRPRLSRVGGREPRLPTQPSAAGYHSPSQEGARSSELPGLRPNPPSPQNAAAVWTSHFTSGASISPSGEWAPSHPRHSPALRKARGVCALRRPWQWQAEPDLVPGPRSQVPGRANRGEPAQPPPQVPPSCPWRLCLPSHPGRPSPKATSIKSQTGGSFLPRPLYSVQLSLRAAKVCVLAHHPTRPPAPPGRPEPPPGLQGLPPPGLPAAPCSPSRPWGLLSQASPCRQPQLTVKAQDKARARECPGCRGQAAGPGGVVGGASMIRRPGALQFVLWGHSSNSLSSPCCCRVESKMGRPLEAIWRREGGGPERHRCF